MKRAIQSGAFSVNGENVVINSDDVYEDDDWRVKAMPKWFVDADKHPDVVHIEQATATPGEVRKTQRP